jgi:guanylate kinase
MAAMERGELFVLSAPSGTGKTTLIHAMMKGLAGFGGLAFSVSHTTRQPRRGEVDDVAYHFVDRPTFAAMTAADEFLECAEVHGNLYGTARSEVESRLGRGLDVILDIDVQGAEQVMARVPEAHSIFVMPPSYHDLEWRLRRRGLDDPSEIARRLAVSLSEIMCYERYEYVIINDDAARASEILAAIILEKRHRQGRMKSRVVEVLEDFQATAQRRR